MKDCASFRPQNITLTQHLSTVKFKAREICDLKSIQEVAGCFDGVKWDGNSFMALCPCHSDRKQSLKVSIGDNGGIVLHCHAGCETGDILQRVGLNIQDIMPEREAPKKSGFDFQSIVATYEYPNGTRKLRDIYKGFMWQHKAPSGEWVPKRGDAPHVLYHAGGPARGKVYLVEGEKDADNVGRLGLHAVSSENGADKGGKGWYPSYTDELAGLDVVVLPDNDDVGRKYMDGVAAEIDKVAKSVKVLDLTKIMPDLPEKGDVSDMIAHLGPEATLTKLAELEAVTDEWVPFTLSAEATPYTATAAADFGEDQTSFVWYPYIPVGDYTVLMAPGGTGKTYLICGIAAAVSRGEALPGDLKPGAPHNVLIISAEDRGELLKRRLQASGADLSRVLILDCMASEGLNFTDGYSTFKATIQAYKPALVVIDPWHGFVGADADLNKVNAVRPIFQKLANVAKACECGLILVSHVNKRAQGENVNNAATGSTDFINAARSALYVIFDEQNDDARIMVHTKSNYARHGRSVIFSISNGGISWDGFSDIDRQTMEEAARSRKTPGEVVKGKAFRDGTKDLLIRALDDAAIPFDDVRFTYEGFKRKYGGDVFGTYQPKRILDEVVPDMIAHGYEIITGKQVRDGDNKGNGFVIHPVSTPPDQMSI